MKRRIELYRQGESEGFTLIELLIVIIIIGILAAIVVFSVSGVQNTAGKNACQQNVNEANTAVEAYYAAKTAWPPATGTGAALVTAGFLHSNPETANISGEPNPTYDSTAHNYSAACV